MPKKSFTRQDLNAITRAHLPFSCPFSQVMEASFSHMLEERLRSNQTHRFRKDWIYDAVRWCRAQVKSSVALCL